MNDSLLVVTAGHIDHGKTSLIRALTGVELDRLPEEKARGITIALGFTSLSLPSGRVVSFVDAPGHERFVRTMASGAHGVDAALLVIAADDGVMPQTREHLAVLELLGVAGGAVVITKVDTVDNDLRELVEEEARELVEGTVLEGAPVVSVSSLRGDGLDALVAALTQMPRRVRATAAPFRLAVDRAFVRPGFGVVVTGTASGVPVHEGDAVHLWPAGDAARVRGLHVHGDAVASSRAGQRVAINLAGVELAQVCRGVVVGAEALPCSSMLDVSVRHLDADVALGHGDRVALLLGTQEVGGRVYLAGEADHLVRGDAAFAQLRLDAPVVCLAGDRFVLRRPSPARTLGGGVVLDPQAPRMRPRDRARAAQALAALAAGDLGVWLLRAGDSGRSVQDWQRMGEPPGVVLADRVVHPSVVSRWTQQIVAALQAAHKARPLHRGVPRTALVAAGLEHLAPRVFDALIAWLHQDGRVVVEEAWVRMPHFSAKLSAAQESACQHLLADVGGAGLTGVPDDDVAALVPGQDARALLHWLARQGDVVRVPDLGWVGSAAVSEVRTGLVAWFAQSELPLTPAAFRDLFVLSRRTTLPWLAWTDAQAWTARAKEGRTAGSQLHADRPIDTRS